MLTDTSETLRDYPDQQEMNPDDYGGPEDLASLPGVGGVYHRVQVPPL